MLATRNAFSILSAAAALLMLWNAWRAVAASLDWRLVHDGPVLQYTALMILKGYLPYRDIVEINLPFTYWVYMAGIALFGKSDLAFRLFDLSLTLLAALGIALLCRPRAPKLGIAAGAAFLVVHVANGAASMGQRDLIMTPFLLWGTLAFLRAARAACPRRWWFLAGLSIGCALAIKPVALLFGLMLAASAAWSAGAWRPLLPHLASYGAGLVLPLLASLLWVGFLGVWPEFLDVMTHLVAAVYAGVEIGDWFEKTGILATCAAGMMLLTFAAHAGERRGVRHLSLQAGLAYGLLHYLLQRKGFWYNLYPFYGFGAAALACGLPALYGRLRAEGKLLLALGLAAACLYASPMGLLSPRRLYGGEWLTAYFRQLDRNMDEVRTHLLAQPGIQAPPWRIHFFDFTVGALWNYAYRNEWTPVSRFQHPYPFYMPGEAMRRYRAEMLAGLEKTPPHVVLVSKQSWPREDGEIYRVIDGENEIHDFFAAHYALFYQNGMYRIYTLKEWE